VGQVERVEQHRGALLPGVGPVESGDVLQVLVDAEVVVEDGGVGDPRRGGTGLDAPRRLPDDPDGAGGGLEETGDEAEQRRLAGAVRPDEHHQLPGGHLEVEGSEAEARRRSPWQPRRSSTTLTAAAPCGWRAR
jgi:hypothetical protein